MGGRPNRDNLEVKGDRGRGRSGCECLCCDQRLSRDESGDASERPGGVSGICTEEGVLSES